MLQSILTPEIRSAIAQYTANHLDALDADRLTPMTGKYSTRAAGDFCDYQG
jgi:hypothetical protein